MDTPAKLTSTEENSLAAVPRPRLPPLADERREIDHRLSNSLQLAADFLIFEQARLVDLGARAALMQAASRLTAVAQLHRFMSAHQDASGVDLEPFLTELCSRIVGSTGLSCSVDADPVEVPGAAAQQLAIAINELAMNAAKHAYPKGQPGGLHVECRRDGAILRLTVADDGVGLGPGFDADQSMGLGMTIVKAVVRQLRGSLDARDDHGARFTITLPLSPAAKASRSFAPPDKAEI
ncbi:sensor histidine kinase [Phenylobacterium sp.]|uniref:sensor histidine kinase n=1 Tax=Phenylobacterium sp. TaxID=1871053 RepID=UPI00356A14F0